MTTPEAPKVGIFEPSTGALSTPRDIPLPPIPSLSPIDSVIDKLKAPGQFTKLEQVFVLKAHGLKDGQIGKVLDAKSRSSIKSYISEEVVFSGLGSSIGLIIGLRSDRLTPLFREGLNFNLYRRLTQRQRDVLDTMADQEMWNKDMEEVADRLGMSKQNAKNHSVAIYKKLGVGNRIQAIVYRLFIPEEMIDDPKTLIREEVVYPSQSVLTPREEEVRKLMADGGALSNREIAKRLGKGVGITEVIIGRIYRKFNVSSRAELMRVFAEQNVKTGEAEA